MIFDTKKQKNMTNHGLKENLWVKNLLWIELLELYENTSNHLTVKKQINTEKISVCEQYLKAFNCVLPNELS